MAGRALVLGGGGVTGVAWETGVLAGLSARGIDLTSADLVVGTSAGAVVGAQVALGASVDALYRAQLAPPGSDFTARMGLRAKLGFVWAVVWSPDSTTACVRVGRMAMATPPVPEAVRRGLIAARVPSQEWPSRRLLITAVDVETGEFAAFDSASAVSLIEAVTASCAVPGVWPPISLRGRWWMDGGMRSAANADLASGCDRVVIVAPMIRGLAPMASVPDQVGLLRRGGAAVAVVSPDKAARSAIGRNLLDTARAKPAARAGYAQAALAADEVARVWGRAAQLA